MRRLILAALAALVLAGCTQYDGRPLPTCSECVGGDYRPECAGRCCGGG